jgi:Histidine phosphatase superfamily (branch 2)
MLYRFCVSTEVHGLSSSSSPSYLICPRQQRYITWALLPHSDTLACSHPNTHTLTNEALPALHARTQTTVPHSGINRKLQLKPQAWLPPTGSGDGDGADGGSGKDRATELELILKWGGELTKLGERQAMELGDNFRRWVQFSLVRCFSQVWLF